MAAVALIEASAPAKVLLSAADTMKRILLELGGKKRDGHLSRRGRSAVEGAVRGMNFTWCGQSRSLPSRLYAPLSRIDEFMQRMAEELARKHRPGIATHLDTTMGAMASRAQYDRALHYIQASIDEGAVLLTGNTRRAMHN